MAEIHPNLTCITVYELGKEVVVVTQYWKRRMTYRFSLTMIDKWRPYVRFPMCKYYRVNGILSTLLYCTHHILHSLRLLCLVLFLLHCDFFQWKLLSFTSIDITGRNDMIKYYYQHQCNLTTSSKMWVTPKWQRVSVPPFFFFSKSYINIQTS